MQARYDLAVDAIKTFHTGVSEDFLLKEEKFKELRDRLLKSASDFYGKLGALLGKETDLASRRALAQSNFELADLTGKVGRNEDALAAHRAVLAAREALAAEPGAGAVAKVDVGRSLIAVAGLLEATGKTDEALATYRAVGVAAGRPGGCRSVGAGRAGGLPVAAGLAPVQTTGKTADALAAFRLARADQEALAAAPEASNDARRDLADTIDRIGALLCGDGQAGGGGGRVPPGAGDPAEAGRRQPRRHRVPQRPGDQPRQPRPPAERAASPRRRRPSTAGRWRSIRSWPTTTPPSPIPQRPGVEPQQPRLVAVAHGQAGGGGGRVPQGAGDPQKLADDHPAVTGFRDSLAHNHINLGHVLSSMGKPSEAEAEYRQALAIYQKLADDNPAVTDFRSYLASSHYSLGILLRETGKPAEAEAEYRKAMAIHQKLADDNPAVTDFRNSLA